jgi:hypothetical protein
MLRKTYALQHHGRSVATCWVAIIICALNFIQDTMTWRLILACKINSVLCKCTVPVTLCLSVCLSTRLSCLICLLLGSKRRFSSEVYEIIINPLTPELNPSAQSCLMIFFTGNLLLEPYISLIYAWETNKYTYNNYSFSLLIMYGSSYIFRHYIAILRELS